MPRPDGDKTGAGHWAEPGRSSIRRAAPKPRPEQWASADGQHGAPAARETLVDATSSGAASCPC